MIHVDAPGPQVMTALSVAKEALQRKAISSQPGALAEKAMEQGQTTFTIPEVYPGCLIIFAGAW